MQCFVVWNNEIEGRLDADFYKPEFRKHLTTLSGICFKELGEMVEFSNETWDQKSIYNDKFPYIEISEVDITSGEIRNIIYYEKEKAPSRAKMIVREDDIIVSTTRPHRGAISLIDESKNSYIASTGFAVLRGLKTDKASRDFLFHILKTSLCLNQMLQRSSGGNYPAITTEDLKKIKIPLPPLPIQNQIVDIMQSAYSQKKQMEAEAQRLLDSIDSYVLDELGIKLPEVEDKMCFVVNSEELKEKRADSYYYQPKFIKLIEAMRKTPFEIETLEDLSTKIINGLDFREFTKTGIPYLRVSNIKPNSFDVSDVKFIPAFSISKDIELDSGDLLITRKGTYGISVIVDDEHKSMVISSEIFRIVLKKDNVNPHYIAIYLNSNIPKQLFNRISTGGIMGHISQDALKNIQIILPSLEIQNKIAEEVKRRMSEAERLKAEANKIIEEVKKTVEDIILLKD